MIGLQPRSRRTVLLDLAAGFVAILATVGAGITTGIVGSDARALFATSAVAFFVAGLARARSEPRSALWKGVLVSSPGLLGDGALIMNDGLHRWLVPVAITLASIAFATLGVQTRRIGVVSRGRAVALAAASGAALVALVLVAVPSLSVLASLQAEDRAAPAFALTDRAGQVVSSSELRGRVVVLAFWASWCLPCRWELPEIAKLEERYRNDPGVSILAVDVGWSGETAQRGQATLARLRVEVPAVFDSGGAARALGVDSLPTVILLDAEGRVRYVHHGYDASEHLASLLATRVEELRAGVARGG